MARTTRWGWRALAIEAGALVAFVAFTVLLRGVTISDWTWTNPDEAELMAQARAAQHSLLPFTTWSMGSTGPWWPMFLALLGALGLPLTLAFAHLLAAAMVGAMGYLVWVIARRAWGKRAGLAIAGLWWLPLAIIYPVGSKTNFGALSTELLPVLLILGSAAIPTGRLAARPLLFVVPGLLGALAVGAKYQALPVVLALLAVQVMLEAPSRRQTWISVGWWLAGALAPFAALATALLLSRDASGDLIRENVNFLGSYGGDLALPDRLSRALTAFSRPAFLAVLLVFVGRLAALSVRRVMAARLILVAGGLVAVLAGGMGFGHYLWFLYAALAAACAFPVRTDATLVPSPRLRTYGAAAVAVSIVAVMAVGASAGLLRLTSPSTLASALDAQSVPRDATVESLCPPGSNVLVWGWAPELYVYYSWHNAVPFMNTLSLQASSESHRAAAPAIESGLAESRCVVDATGEPFFNPDPAGALAISYPEYAPVLERDFEARTGVLGCESCTLYVRD